LFRASLACRRGIDSSAEKYSLPEKLNPASPVVGDWPFPRQTQLY
jgi:hypothetical protein